MRTRPPLHAGAAAIACALATSTAAQDFSGFWHHDQYGYVVQILQAGDTVTMVADQDNVVPRYDTMRRGDVLGRGKVVKGRIDATTAFFNHETAQSKCGLPARSDADSVIRATGNDRLAMRTTALDPAPGSGPCRLERRTFEGSLTRVSRRTGYRCPSAPGTGATVETLNKVLQFVLAVPSPSDTLSAVQTYATLADRLKVLKAVEVGPLLEHELPLLNKHVRQTRKEQWEAGMARSIGAGVLPQLASCVGESDVNERFYELNLYGVERATCVALSGKFSEQIRLARINGSAQGTCESDIAINWELWKTVGRNHVVLTINPL